MNQIEKHRNDPLYSDDSSSDQWLNKHRIDSVPQESMPSGPNRKQRRIKKAQERKIKKLAAKAKKK